MKICPQCQTKYANAKQFCHGDGTPLKITPSVETALLTLPTCAQCGQQGPPDKHLCWYCGASLPSPIERLEHQLAAEPTNVATLTALAEAYLQADQAQQAVSLLENAAEPPAADPHRAVLLGQALEASGQEARAVDTYLAALQRHGEHPALEAALFRKDLLCRTYPRSVEALADLAPTSTQGRLWSLLADVSEAQNDPDRAVTFLTAALTAHPNDLASAEALARIQTQQDNRVAAQRWHAHVLTLAPDSPAANLFFAQTHYTQGAYTEASVYFERLLARDPTSRLYQVYWLLAQVKAHGIQGYDNSITDLLSWPALTHEEQPLVVELFMLAGTARLTQEDPTGAEPYLHRAHALSPSPASAQLLARVEADNGKHAQEQGDLRGAIARYQRAARYDPDHPSYSQTVEQLTILRAEAARHKRLALQQKVLRGTAIGLAALLFIGIGIGSYRSIREADRTPSPAEKERPLTLSMEPASRPPSPGKGEEVDPNVNRVPVASFVAPLAERSRLGRGEASIVSEEGEKRAQAQAAVPVGKGVSQGTVITAAALGLRVLGPGQDDPHRSPAALQHAVAPRLAALQDLYDAARQTAPSLMGSLVLALQVAASGQIVAVDLETSTIASPLLQERVQQRVQDWRFPPASAAVQVTVPLLFLPPHIDAPSILAWESRGAALDVERTAVQTQAAASSPKPASTPRPVAQPAPKQPKPTLRRGLYRVVSRTPLHRQPRATAAVVTHLRAGMRVEVVRQSGAYLEVRSRKGNPPGYVSQNAVVSVRSR